MFGGKLFQSLGAATPKARSHCVFKHNLGTFKSCNKRCVTLLHGIHNKHSGMWVT